MTAEPHELPREWAAALAAGAPRLDAFGRDVRWYSRVGSTNDVAAAAAQCGAPEGTVVLADAQTAGRGRQGRVWASPPGAGLYVSIVLRPPADIVPLVTIAAGVALADAVRETTGLAPALKWPNDLLIGGRKLAGILAEAGTQDGSVAYVIVGFGMNLRHAAYPADVAVRVTSLERELGRPVDSAAVLVECLAAWRSRYDGLRRGSPDVVVAAWRAYAATLFGRPVEFHGRDGVEHGIASDVDGRGALLVTTHSGMARVVSGEVRWL